MYVAEFDGETPSSDHANVSNKTVLFLYKLPMPGPAPPKASILTDTLIKNFEFAFFGVIVMANLVAPVAKGSVLLFVTYILSEILYDANIPDPPEDA